MSLAFSIFIIPVTTEYEEIHARTRFQNIKEEFYRPITCQRPPDKSNPTGADDIQYYRVCLLSTKEKKALPFI